MRMSTRFFLKALTTATIAATNMQIASAQTTNFAGCLAGLEEQANKAGIARHTYRDLTTGLSPDLSILEKLDYQPEFRLAIWDYLAALVDQERVDTGLEMLKEHASVLQRVANQYGVDPATVVAVWGVESNFGMTQGKYPLIQALGTLSCMGRRQDYFRKEFFATMRIIQSGDIAQERLVGSWAGAFGHTQFMPTTFERLAVDFDGDGRRDLMDNVNDALASTANYLKRNGWQTGQPWGVEVKLPAGFNTKGEGRRTKKAISNWASRGVTLIDGSALSNFASGSQKAGLVTPAGPSGPAFLTFKNFDVIYSYNAAESYALAIGHLADRLRGGGEFVTPWPTDDLGLSRAERKELQTLLIQRGHDIGEVDGLIGSKTREAVKVEQARLGMKVDGHPGQKILKALQQ